MQDKRREEQVREGEGVKGEVGEGRGRGGRGGEWREWRGRGEGCSVCVSSLSACACVRGMCVCVCVCLCVLTTSACSLTKDRGANLDGRRQDVEKAGREYSQLKLQRDELSNERKSVREMREGVLWC